MKRLLILFISIVSGLLSFGQQPFFFEYSERTGFEFSELYSIAIDSSQFIWLGADGGLYQFNGLTSKHHSCATQQSRSAARISFVNGNDFCYYNFKGEIFYKTDSGIVEIEHELSGVRDLVVSHEKIFVSNGRGVAIYDLKTGNWKLPLEKDNEDFPNAGILAVRSNGSVVCVADGCLMVLDNGEKHRIAAPMIGKDEAGFYTSASEGDYVWFFSSQVKKVLWYNGKEVQEYRNQKLIDILGDRKITSVKYLSDGYMWICTYNGVIRWRPRTEEITIYYPENSFSDIVMDTAGQYWLSSLQTGVIKIKNLDYLEWTDKGNKLLKTKITHLVASGTDELYFSSIIGKVGKLENKSEVLVFPNTPIADVQSLDYLETGEVVFNINNTIYTEKKGQLHTLPIEISTVKSLASRNGTLAAASSFGVYLMDEKFNENIQLLERGRFRKVWWDRHGKLWAIGNEGLRVFTIQKNVETSKMSWLDHTQILAATYNEKDDRVYCADFQGRLYEIYNNSIVSLGNIGDNAIVHSIEHYHGVLLIASNVGLIIWNLKGEELSILTSAQGLMSNVIYDVAVLDNKIWLATGKGLESIPVLYQDKFEPATIFIKKISINGSGVEWSGDVSANYQDFLSINFEVSGLDLNNSYQLRYKIDAQSEWIYIPIESEKINLGSGRDGTLEFELQVVDDRDRLVGESQFIRFKVSPPIWRSWWFLMVVIVLITISILVGVRWYTRHIERREKQKTDLIQSQLKALRAQMNPHFMYNSLNSIQDLILRSDIRNANYYFNRFSHLMRQILNFSDEEETLVEDEMKMLNNYLELEKLRFGDDFNFDIICEATVEKERAYVPSLLIQPFVENAIKHGLLHKKGKKWVSIRFRSFNNTLVVEVEDNGVGRKKVAEIQSRLGKSFKSFSSDAAMERVELHNQSRYRNVKIHILDLEENEEALGTKVVIEIADL